MRVVIAEDLALLRDGLTRLLTRERLRGRRRGRGRRRASCAPSMGHRPGRLRRRRPAAADVHRRGRARRARGARADARACRCSMLSQYVERTYAAELLADGRGGVGYLLKDRVADVREFVDAVRRVAERRHGAGSRGRRPAARRPRPTTARSTSSRPREREVLGLMAEGRTNQRDRRRASSSPRARSRSTSRTSSASSGCRRRDADHRRVLAVLAFLNGEPADRWSQRRGARKSQRARG